jgi:hypothetical protein
MVSRTQFIAISAACACYSSGEVGAFGRNKFTGDHETMQQKIADDFDRRILKALHRGRAHHQQRSWPSAIGLSPSPCLRRVRRMEETGVIRGYTALRRSRLRGLDMSAIADHPAQPPA